MGKLPSCCTYGGLRKTEPGHMEMSWKIQLFPLPSSRSWAPKVFVHAHHTNPSPAAAAPPAIPPRKIPQNPAGGELRGLGTPKIEAEEPDEAKTAPRPSQNNLL